MQIWTGHYGRSGSPVLNIKVSGPFTEGKDYEAILDTGFTGFLSMPLSQAISLGLILHGTTAISLADGSRCFRITAKGHVQIGEESQVGVVILEPTSTEVLLGMAFLRLFKRAILVSEHVVALLSGDELAKISAKSKVRLLPDRSEAMTPPSNPSQNRSVLPVPKKKKPPTHI